MSTTFSQQILGDKLLLVLNWANHFKLCIKKKKKQAKSQLMKIVTKIVTVGVYSHLQNIKDKIIQL